MTFPSLASRAPDAFFSRPNASAEIAAQYQRRSTALIIALTPPDVAEAGAAIQRTRGGVVFIDFEKHGPGAESGEAAQVQIEQRSGKPPSTLTPSDGDREDFRFSRRHARQNETGHGCAAHGAMGDDGFFDQQPVNFVLTPAALERGFVQSRDRGGIVRPRFR